MVQPFKAIALLAGVLAVPALAGEADVISAEALQSAPGVWRFTVTVKHADEGWEHYANRFEIVDEAGKVLGVRTLYHPHVDEQPFTRSLGGVSIPLTVEKVRVRAGDSVHDLGGAEVVVDLSALRADVAAD